MLRIKQFNATFYKTTYKNYKWHCRIVAKNHNIKFNGVANTKKQALYNAYDAYTTCYGINLRRKTDTEIMADSVAL